MTGECWDDVEHLRHVHNPSFWTVASSSCSQPHLHVVVVQKRLGRLVYVTLLDLDTVQGRSAHHGRVQAWLGYDKPPAIVCS